MHMLAWAIDYSHACINLQVENYSEENLQVKKDTYKTYGESMDYVLENFEAMHQKYKGMLAD